MQFLRFTLPPLTISPVSAGRSPGWGVRHLPSDISQGGGGGGLQGYTHVNIGGVLVQHGHNSIYQGEIGGFGHYWQYSCLYRPYYTPTWLDGLMLFFCSDTGEFGHQGKQCA